MEYALRILLLVNLAESASNDIKIPRKPMLRKDLILVMFVERASILVGW